MVPKQFRLKYCIHRLLQLWSLMMIATAAFAQEQPGNLEFRFTFNQQPIVAGQSYYLSALEDSVWIETLRMYISNLTFYRKGKPVKEWPKKHQLLDVEQNGQLILKTPASSELVFDQIRFNVGIDSATNASGVFGGDLDPTNGMYWTWQSGYINFKLEGITPKCKERHHRFTYHIGGYQAPFYAIQEVTLSKIRSNRVVVEVAIDELLSQIQVPTIGKVMSPNAEAMKIAAQLPTIFTIAK